MQTKHHLARAAALTDASSDLWKTLRVWFEGVSARTISDRTQLYLVTTSAAGTDSAASKLRESGRDVAGALKALEATAQTSKSTDNAAAYAAFLATPISKRQAILERVVVLDRTPVIGDLNDQLKLELFWATERNHQDAFLQYLEGWWFRRVIVQLTKIQADDRVLGAERLGQVLETIVAQAKLATPGTIKLKTEGGVAKRLSQVQAVHLANIAREALSNVIRHANAREVQIELRIGAAEEVVLEISDNGQGINGDSSLAGHGLKNMRARAEELGGRFECASEQNQGTTIRIVLPLPRVENGEAS